MKQYNNYDFFLGFFFFLYTQVKAYDRDPADNGGTITYTFVSAPGERSKFSIDAQTGVITTRYVSIIFKKKKSLVFTFFFFFRTLDRCSTGTNPLAKNKCT